MDIKEFIRKNAYLLCVDSDGCAMDTMDIKHKKCFGPCLITEWDLQEYKEQILTYWNDINLYTRTRGINRFKGLAMTLVYIDKNITPIEGVGQFKEWADNAKELSNAALKTQLGNGEVFRKALAWSVALNKEIDKLKDEEKVAFKGVKEALKEASKYFDTVIVSSANRKAVEEEWERCGILQYMDVTMTQENGSKADCIAALLEKGYDKNRVLMVGDALGDLQAAEKNGVSYYPILVKHEAGSWQTFLSEAISKFIGGEYIGEYAEELKDKFYKNLGV